jgi:hypothetical protein
LSATNPNAPRAWLALADELAAPALDRDARAQLALCFQPLMQTAWPELCDSFSRLTRDGCPVEFGFGATGNALRVTLEPAGPEVRETERLDIAIALLAGAGLHLPHRALVRHWRAMQGGRTLRWGTWLGLKQADKALNAKLYLEVPKHAPAPYIHTALGGRLRMLGHDVASGATERYFSLPRITAKQLADILDSCGTDAPAMLHLVERCLGVPLETALAFISFGLSTVERDGRPTNGAAIFFRANAVPRGQAWLHAALSAKRHANHTSGAFEALEACAASDHGVVSVVASSDGSVDLRVGLSAAAISRSRA